MALKIPSGPLRLGGRGGLQIKASSGAFTPASLSPAVWFRADAISGVSVDGTAVSSWTDSSGNGRHALQATGANQPLFKTNILNGKPVVRFDGVNDSLVTGAFTAVVQPLTIFVVGTLSSVASAYLCSGIAAGNRCDILYNNLSMFGGTSVIALTPTVSAPQAAAIYVATFNGASSAFRFAKAAKTVSATPGTNSLTGVTLGARYALDNFWPGDIAEYVLVSGAASAGTITSMESYFATKYGV